MQTLKNEIKIMNQWQHPKIVKIIDLFESYDKFFIVMEYMQGGTLEAYLNKNKFNIS